MATIQVPSRLNGPQASGQGGYSCGLLAAYLDGPAAVWLRRPVPLGRELVVRVEGAAARAFAGEELIAEALPAAALAPWSAPAVSTAEAHAACARFVPPPGGEFDRCFVCGLDREDGFHVFTGPVADTELVASPWTPPAWAADEDGAVRPEHVWAALDCPGYFALHGRDGTLAYLARQQTEILALPHVGVEYAVVGTPLERSGRKGLAATAVLAADGSVLAHAECLAVVPREPMSHE